MTRAVKFQEGHLDVFKILETEDITPEAWESFKQCVDTLVSSHVELLTIICENDITALVGAKTISRGVIQVWMIPGESFKRYRIATHKQVKACLDAIMEKNHRVQMSIRQDFRTGRDWAVTLGFKHESTLVEYDPDGTSHELYVRF